MDINVVYATDFASVGAGGIQSFIRSVGAEAPTDLRVRYFGVGRLAGDLPRVQDEFVPLLDGLPRRGPLNLAFARALRLRGGELLRGAPTVLHRAEHAVALRAGGPALLMLHGGTSFALRARVTPFSVGYPLIESVAAARASRVLSVAADQHWWPTRRLAAVEPMSTCFDPRTFGPGPGPVRSALVTAARLVREKQVHLMIDAARALGWPLTVIGDGPERASLQRQAEGAGVAATFTGQLAPADVAAQYRDAPSVFLMTSRFEGFPVALLEAASCGLPVVGLDAPGLASAVRAVGGHVAADVPSLAATAQAALAVGNRLGPEDIREQYGSAPVARSFWKHVETMVGS